MIALVVPTAGEVWSVAGPLLSIGGVIWLWRDGHRLVAWLFPHLEWEREMGWINIRSQKRAEKLFGAVRNLFYLLLLASLVGVLALGCLLGDSDTESKIGLFKMIGEIVYFVMVLSPWLYWFVQILAPRLKHEFEEEELARYRAENPEEEDRPVSTKSRISVWGATRPRRF